MDPAGSPNRSNDGSGARTPRTGGGGRRPNVEDQPNEDGSDNNDNSDEFIDSLKASEDPMMLKFAEYLSAKDKAISDLQQQVQLEQNKRKTQEAIRDYDETGRSSFQFHPQNISDLLHTFVIPHIRNSADRQFYFDLDMDTAKPEDLSRGISMVTSLPKNVKNPQHAAHRSAHRSARRSAPHAAHHLARRSVHAARCMPLGARRPAHRTHA